MSGKNVKRLRRAIRKSRNALINDFLGAVHSWLYGLRIKLAFQILGRNKRKEKNKIIKPNSVTHEIFAVGDLVRSNLLPKESKIIRKVTCVTESKFTRSKYLISANEGEFCDVCGMRGTPIKDMDASFFVKIKE
jgi:hypothetical protein